VRHPEICDAIRTRRLLMFGYGDSVRVVEPHLYGLTSAGHEIMSAWMRPGQSRSDPDGGWRTFRTDEMREVQALPELFPAPRPDYNPHAERMAMLFCMLPAPDRAAESEPEPAPPADAGHASDTETDTHTPTSTSTDRKELP
jgi:hypothetical protein